MDGHIDITFEDVVDVTLINNVDANRRTEQDISMWLSEYDQLAIEYSKHRPELTLTIDFNNLYVEFEDSEGNEHKVKLL